MTHPSDRGSNAARAGAPIAENSEQETERPLGVIVNDLWVKTESLLRQEMRLGLTEAEEKVEVLKQELGAQISELKTELTLKAIGGGVAAAGLLTLVAALTLLLAEAVAPWLAALIVGVVLAVAGVVLLRREWQPPQPPRAQDLVPERTVHNVKEDVKAISRATRDPVV